MPFTLSLDDFVTTYFTAGVDTVTLPLPLPLYSRIHVAVTSGLNAASALLMLLSGTLVLLAQRLAPGTLRR